MSVDAQSSLSLLTSEADLGSTEDTNAESSLRLFTSETVLAEADPLQAIFAYDNAAITVFGTDFVSTLVDPNYDGGMFSRYLFSGRLADGTEIVGNSLLIQNGTGATFQFLASQPVPLPSTFALLATALLGARFKRRAA